VPSFRLALQLGADAIETDAHLTRDGHVVLSHDPTGERVFGVSAAIAEATLDEVRAWRAGGGHRMPTLEEALRELPGVPFNVDAKSRHPTMAARIVDVVRRAGAVDRTLLASFHAGTLRQVRRLGYEGRTGLGQSEVLRLLALPARLLRWVPLRGDAAQLPHRMTGIDLGTRAVVDRCHALGLEVDYWTVNEPALAARLLEAGADGIMSDDPRAIAPVVAEFRHGKICVQSLAGSE
jgi:glycerophosphoryl diester phosphodiesterase